MRPCNRASRRRAQSPLLNIPFRLLRNLPPLDPTTKEALQKYVERRERELEGKNLYD